VNLNLTIGEAYAELGLKPLAEWAKLESGRPGATTWMLVRAALALIEDKKIVIIGRDLRDAKDLADTCRDYAVKLGGSRLAVRRFTKGPASRRWELDGGAVLHWESERTQQRFWMNRRREDYEVFSDYEHARMMQDRLRGPFAEVRKLVPLPNDEGFAAYNDADEYLFDLTTEGAEQVVDQDPYRVRLEPRPR